MKIREVTWNDKRCLNYQSRQAGVTIELEEGDTPGAAFRRAKAIVGLALGDAPTDAEVERAQNVLERRRLMEEAAR